WPVPATQPPRLFSKTQRRGGTARHLRRDPARRWQARNFVSQISSFGFSQSSEGLHKPTCLGGDIGGLGEGTDHRNSSDSRGYDLGKVSPLDSPDGDDWNRQPLDHLTQDPGALHGMSGPLGRRRKNGARGHIIGAPPLGGQGLLEGMRAVADQAPRPQALPRGFYRQVVLAEVDAVHGEFLRHGHKIIENESEAMSL